jgi:hypothetical protein
MYVLKKIYYFCKQINLKFRCIVTHSTPCQDKRVLYSDALLYL